MQQRTQAFTSEKTSIVSIVSAEFGFECTDWNTSFVYALSAATNDTTGI